MLGVSAVTACAAVKVVSVVKTLLGLSAEGEGRDDRVVGGPVFVWLWRCTSWGLAGDE